MLLAAAFVLANQFGGFVEIGFWSILVAALAIAFIIQSLVKLEFASLPIPLAVLYIVARTPFELPHINTWMLILAAVLASIGLHTLLPNTGIKKKWRNVKVNVKPGKGSVLASGSGDEDDNNPVISVSAGGVSRYLHSDCLETVRLHCSAGGMEIYFDQATLSPDGCTVIIDCKAGGIELYIPKHWRVINNIDCFAGGVDFDNKRNNPAADAPVLTLTGNVLAGGIDITFV
jgi:predicted membrane protein